MAPHPVVQAIIDLTAGALGKLQYFHFLCVIRPLLAMLSTWSHLFCLFSPQRQMAPACRLDCDDSVFFQFISLSFLLTPAAACCSLISLTANA